MVTAYSDRYTWYAPLNEHVMAHSDGFVSLMISWDGLDCEMADKSQLQGLYDSLYMFIDNLGQDFCAEFHWWRERDDLMAKRYLENNKKIIRGHNIAIPVREAMAEHLGSCGFSNSVAVVLMTHYKSVTNNPFVGNKFNAKKQKKAAQNLFEKANKVIRFLKDGKIATIADYCKRIQQSINRKPFLKGHKTNTDYRFDLSEQLVPDVPELTDSGCIRMNGELTRSICLFMYPDAFAGWFLPIASIPMAMHVSFIIKPTHTRKAVDDASDESETEDATQASKGTKYTRQAIGDREEFTNYVTEYNLNIFKNCFIIHLHGSQEEITEYHDLIDNFINNAGGEIRSSANVQGHFFRVAQPGMGLYSNRFRPDETWQVGNMIPCIVYNEGIPGAECLRLTQSCQLAGFSILQHPVANTITIGLMGSGKDVDTNCEILECYPLGLNYFALEAGDSYKWPIEALGGSYTKIDPRNTVVNPLIEYDLADHTKKDPVDLLLLSGTLSSLSFMLLEDTKPMEHAQESAAGLALKNLYTTEPPKNKKAPVLPDFLYSLRHSEYDSDPDAKAGKEMHDKLKSFLNTYHGCVFAQEDNLEIHPTLNGIDLKIVSETSDKLLLFYLIFICLRYTQAAFFKADEPARILCNEIDVYMKSHPEVVGRMLGSVIRMGRKDGCSSAINTQGIYELENLDPIVISGSPLKNLWWRDREWEKISGILDGLPETPLNLWKAYKNPYNLNYRQGMRIVHGKYYDLHLTFPQVVLDIASTSRAERAEKQRIEVQTNDVWERLRLLQDFRGRRPV